MDAEGLDPKPLTPPKEGTLQPRPVLWGVVVVMAIAVVVAAWQFQGWWTKPNSVPAQKQTSGLQGKPFIAVLPFDNMSDDPEQEYFSDGMTEEIITRLSTNPGIFVIARNSTFFYKGKGAPIQQIGQELNARYVVEGSVRKAGNRVRVTAQLIDATTESHIWANTYESEYKDIFNLQDEIAQQVVAALNIKTREAEQARAWRVPTENLTAYDTLLRGVSHFLRLTVTENARAKSNFKKALALDPEYAAAYVLLGYTRFMDFVFGTNRDVQVLEQAAEMFKLDVGRYPSTSEGLVALVEKPGSADGWNGPYLKSGVPLDPWKNEYLYENPGTRAEIEIISLGQDGAQGGDGEDSDVGNW